MKKIVIWILFIGLAGCATSSERMRADDFYAKEDYTNALKSYELAFSQANTTSQRTEITEKIEETRVKIVNDVLKRANTVYQKTDPPTLESIDESLMILKDAATDDSSQRILAQTKKYTLVKKRLVKRQAEILIANGEYSKALETYQHIMALDPDDETLVNEIDRLKASMEKEKKAKLREIERLLKKGDGEKAQALFDNVLLIDPEDPQLNLLKNRITDARRKQLTSNARKDESENKFFTAYYTLNDSGIDGLEKDKSRIAKQGSEYYYKKAQQHFSKGNVYSAYISSVKAKIMAPGDIRISQLNKKCEDLVDKEIQYYIAVLTFGSPAKSPDSGMLFSDDLIPSLLKGLPYGIHIVEKGKVDLLKDTQTMKIKHIGGSLGADLIITGNVSLFKVEDITSEEMATAKIKVGEALENNPEYEKMIKTYGEDTRQWPHIPEMKVRKDTFDVVTYKKGTHSKRAFGNVSLRLFDGSNGAILFAKNFNKSIKKTDTFQDSVERAGIPYDPLELPMDTEVKAELRKKMVDDISAAIIGILQDREKRFFKAAYQHMEQNEYMEAMKSLAQGYVFCDKSKITNEYSKKIFNMMIALTEIE